MLNPPARGTLIGDDIREKWNQFLARALELGYITVPEFTERSAVVLAARTNEEILPALRDFPRSDIEAWSAQWEPRLPSLFAPPPVKEETAVPATRPRVVRYMPGIMGALGVIVLILLVCIELTR